MPKPPGTSVISLDRLFDCIFSHFLITARNIDPGYKSKLLGELKQITNAWPQPIPGKPEFLGDEAQELGFVKDPVGGSDV